MSTGSEDWVALVESYQQSGAHSIAAFCREHQLNYDTFLYHFRKRYPAKSTGRCIPVSVLPDRARDNASAVVLAKIELSNGRTLHIFDKHLVLQLIAE